MAVGHMAPGGVDGAINIFSVTPSRLKWLLQLARYRTLRVSQWRARNYSGREAGNITLKRLDILHTATWLQLGRFPRIPGEPPEDFNHILFCSNFAGEWDPYRQAFLDVLGGGIRSAWGSSEGFGRFPRRGSRYQLEEWQRHRLPPTLHYYRAYAGSAPSEIRGAVRLSRDLRAFAFRATGRFTSGGECTYTAFHQLRARLAVGLGASPSGIVPGAVFGPPTSTGMSNFVCLVPILPGREEDVVAHIRRLPRGDASPFRNIEGTHFARLAVLDRRTADYHPERGFVLRHSWLLLAADIDGHFGVREADERTMAADEVTRYTASLDSSHLLRRVWQHCIGFRADRPLTELIVPNLIRRFVLFLDHGDVTLREVDAALRLKHAFLERLRPGGLDDEESVLEFLDLVRTGATAPQLATAGA